MQFRLGRVTLPIPKLQAQPDPEFRRICRAVPATQMALDLRMLLFAGGGFWGREYLRFTK